MVALLPILDYVFDVAPSTWDLVISYLNTIYAEPRMWRLVYCRLERYVRSVRLVRRLAWAASVDDPEHWLTQALEARTSDWGLRMNLRRPLPASRAWPHVLRRLR